MEKILIVDDTPKNIQTVATILRNVGYNIAYATNSESAIYKLKQVAFDLILLDTIMPDIDGFDFCKLLRKQQNNGPILFMLPRNNEHNIAKAFESGATDYISKPFIKDELIARVAMHLKLNAYETQSK